MTIFPEPFIPERLPTEDLLRDLCDRLEFVGAGGGAFPNNPTLELAIEHLQAIHSELLKRQADCLPAVTALGERRGWEIQNFLADCLSFPARVPYVREDDGIRLAFRCRMCQRAEHPPGAKLFSYCSGCMERILAAVRQRSGCEGIFIFRTVQPGMPLRARG
jgi:hypothetical protein